MSTVRTAKFFSLSDIHNERLPSSVSANIQHYLLWCAYANALEKSGANLNKYRIVERYRDSYQDTYLYIDDHHVGYVAYNVVGQTRKTKLWFNTCPEVVSINNKKLLDAMMAHFIPRSFHAYVTYGVMKLVQAVSSTKTKFEKAMTESSLDHGDPLAVVHGLLRGDGDIPRQEFERQFGRWIQSGYFDHRDQYALWAAFEGTIKMRMEDYEGRFVMYNSDGSGIVIDLPERNVISTRDVMQTLTHYSAQENLSVLRVTNTSDPAVGVVINHDPHFDEGRERTFYYIP